MQNVRLDKYLWAVRIFKTRSDAADAIRNNRVVVNGAYAKPSRDVKQGDRLTVKRNNIEYSYQVVALVSNRQGAKLVADYCIDTTPQSELDKLNRPKETIFIARDPGTGRPTKRDRRELDELMTTLLDEL